MLVWINGAFGSGKTQSAFELHRRAPDTHVADPELIGHAMHKMLPAVARRDYQDLPQWRAAATAMLIDVEAAHGGPVIVPMTMVEVPYFDEIVGGLRAAGVDVRHFALAASRETLLARLKTRSAYWIGKAFGRDESWAMQQIDRCVEALASERFAIHIETDGRSIDGVVEDIAAQAGIALTEPRLSVARYQLRRLAVGVRHIRL